MTIGHMCTNGWHDACPMESPYCDCRCHNTVKQKTTMTRRYYATSSAIEYNKLLGTLSEAIEDGKKKLTYSGSRANKLGEIYIVEVVRIIRFESQPEVKPIEVIEIRK